jgi:glycerophosphodiester phosphodiesterase
MKFGRNLPRNVVPEWSSSYIRYKALKKLIKSLADRVRAGHEADLAGEPPLLRLLDRPAALLTLAL